jgi:CubicO group peptidase (beta-lactamase class C family)
MMEKNLILFYVALMLVLLYAQSATGQKNSKKNELLAKYVELQHKRIGFSGTVLVANDNEIISWQSVGNASIQLNVPFAKDSKFNIASITKTFTGLLIALAQKEGKLHYNDALASFFPELTNEKWKNITVLHLVSHASGIPHWSGITDYWSIKSRLSLNKDEALREIFKMKLLFEPGTQSSYSSPAYFLLGAILEKTYKKTYKELLHKKILDPLQLNETGVLDESSIIPGMVSGYHLASDDSLIAAPYRNASLMTGGGNMFASASNLLQWCRSFLVGSMWDAEIVKELFTPSIAKQTRLKANSIYNMGWQIREELNGRPTACHTGGGTYGFSSKIAIYPNEKLYVIILSNVSFMPMDDVLWRDIEMILFDKPFELPKQLAELVSLEVQKMEKYVGLYSAGGMELNVFIHGNKLYVKLGGNPPLEIYAKNENEFFSKKIDVKFNFSLDDAGRVKGLQSENRGRTDSFSKK